MYARLAAERRLQNAEQTLTRLENIIQQQGVDGRDMEETRNEMMGDVKRLKGASICLSFTFIFMRVFYFLFVLHILNISLVQLLFIKDIW